MRSGSPIEETTDRRERIRALGYRYEDQPRQTVEACNLCGSSQMTVVAHRDRYGFPTTAMACRKCGLVFLNPVMTAESYQRFYADIYRPLVSAFHGRLIDARTIQGEQREYAQERGDFIAPYLEGRGFSTLLDIGGSTGVVCHAWATRFGLKGSVIDPSPMEIEEARRLGLETVAGMVEDWDAAGQTFDVVVMCQTVDHLLDVSRTLSAVRRLLRKDGIFFVDIVDFRAAYLRNWSVEAAIKIDHPYYFTEATIEAYLWRVGFSILRADYAADHLHVGYVCRPSRPLRDALPAPGDTDAMWREIRYVQNTPRA